ncbi:MAG: Prenyltransferase [Acidimicrobiales bacterium]|nr:Prenyltransferase [Acidimicrobiales bacterium]
MPRRRSVAAVLAVLAVPFLVPSPAAIAAPAGPRVAISDPVVQKAYDYLLTQQQADGGFEAQGFTLFETPDVVFALAGIHQTGPAWNLAQAKAGVQEHVVGGHTALDYVDAKVDAEAPATTDQAKAGLAARTAKIVALVAGPLGIDAGDFDPSANSPEAVDLWARIDAVRNLDGTYAFPGQLNGVLYVALAKWATGTPVPAPVVGQIKAAQRGDGSWDYSGEVTPTGADIDTTATALLALHRAGLPASDPAVKAGIAFLAAQQGTDGAWSSFGSPDPNSTSVATIALSALEVDVSSRGWRDLAAPGRAGDAYASPLAWLASQQRTDGRITSPNDGFGINTFATSQTAQALSRVFSVSPERDAYVHRLAALLTTKWTEAAPMAAHPGEPSPLNLGIASAALGANPSLIANRKAASVAVLGSDGYRRAAAAELFQRSLGRTTDDQGETYWANRLKTITRQNMIAALIASPEFYGKAGSTPEGFVNRAYTVVFFGRAADDSGRAYWVQRLNTGTSRSDVAKALLASAEYRQKEVTAQFQRLLGRAPDTATRDSWASRLRTERIEVLLRALATSPELYGKATG